MDCNNNSNNIQQRSKRLHQSIVNTVAASLTAKNRWEETELLSKLEHKLQKSRGKHLDAQLNQPCENNKTQSRKRKAEELSRDIEKYQVKVDMLQACKDLLTDMRNVHDTVELWLTKLGGGMLRALETINKNRTKPLTLEDCELFVENYSKYLKAINDICDLVQEMFSWDLETFYNAQKQVTIIRNSWVTKNKDIIEMGILGTGVLVTGMALYHGCNLAAAVLVGDSVATVGLAVFAICCQHFLPKQIEVTKTIAFTAQWAKEIREKTDETLQSEGLDGFNLLCESLLPKLANLSSEAKHGIECPVCYSKYDAEHKPVKAEGCLCKNTFVCEGCGKQLRNCLICRTAVSWKAVPHQIMGVEDKKVE